MYKNTVKKVEKNGKIGQKTVDTVGKRKRKTGGGQVDGRED